MKHRDYVKWAKNVAKGAAVVAAGYHSHGNSTSFKPPWNHYKPYQNKIHSSPKNMLGDDLHSGVSRTHIKVNCGPPPHGMLKTGSIKTTDTFDVSFTLLAGRQTTIALSDIGCVNQAIDTTATPFISQNTYSYSAVQLSPDQGAPASGIWTATTNLPQGKMCIKNAVMYVQIANQSSAKAYVDVYVVQAKQNIIKATGGAYKFADNVWADSLVDESRGQPNLIFRQAAVTPVAGNNLKEHLHAKPTECYGFNKMFKVLKKHCCVLGGGAEEEVTININHNMTLDFLKIMALNVNVDATAPGTWIPANFSYGLLKGGICVFLVARGGIINSDQLTNDGTTTSGNQIRTIVTRKISYSLMKSPNAKFEVTKGNTTISTNVPVGNQKIVNITDSVVAEVNN